MAQPDPDLVTPSAQDFATTHWSIILIANGAVSDEADSALEYLCRAYWYPLYAYVRRQGHHPSDAQDLTQDFFTRFLERKYLRLADPERGRFRSFLLCSLKHFLINEWHKSRAAKRGGAHSFVSWDDQSAEDRYLAEPIDGLTPERIYEKRWAVTLLEKVLARLREQYTLEKKGPLFEALKPYLWDETMGESYENLAAPLNISAGAIRVAMHRLRGSYRELLREEVARTVASPADVDEELRDLVNALRN